MKAILIVKKEPGMDHGMGHDMNQWGHDAMQNSVGICDCILSDKTDGDHVKATIEGTLMEHDGKRYISIDKVDGEDVEDMEMPMDQNPDEGNQEQDYSQSSNDALDNFIKNQQGK